MKYKLIFHYLLAVFVFSWVKCLLLDFATCHDDNGLEPKDGVLQTNTFPWLAFAEYLHVTTGIPHLSKSPRVVLIHKAFVLGTAQDMVRLPKNYKLGNIIFAEYDREETDCNITRSQIRMGMRCPRAVLEMPWVDIIPHPEFSRFGVGNSLALVKLIRPVKSAYVLPVCVPSVLERERIRRKKLVFMVDYISSVPRDLNFEKMAKKTLKVYTHRECRNHRMRSRLGSEGVTHVLCTSGCGVRSGAPIISHARDGPFELIGLSAVSDTCERARHRNRLNTRPPIYVDVYPYVPWITNVVTATLMPLPYPDNFQLTDSGGLKITKGKQHRFLSRRDDDDDEDEEEQDLPRRSRAIEGWRGRNFIHGKGCFQRPVKMKKMDWFYFETFLVAANPPALLNLYMKLGGLIISQFFCRRSRKIRIFIILNLAPYVFDGISLLFVGTEIIYTVGLFSAFNRTLGWFALSLEIIATVENKIRCVKMFMPSKLYRPSIKGINRHNISIEFHTGWFPYDFYFTISLYAVNATDAEIYQWLYENNPFYDEREESSEELRKT